MQCDSWASLLARNLVRGLGRKPKARVATLLIVILLKAIGDYSINGY